MNFDFNLIKENTWQTAIYFNLSNLQVDYY